MGIIERIMTEEDVVRDGHIIVNHIGEATYIDIQRVSAKELNEIAEYKEWIENVWGKMEDK